MSIYASLDNSPLLKFLFYPRKHFAPAPEKAFDIYVAVEKDVLLFCRCYAGSKDWPWIIYFHGNGEVVSDYNEIAPLYHEREINLVVTDYRGYGSSSGKPTFTNMLKDAHLLWQGVREKVSQRGFGQDFWVMGRSLGSMPALELAHHYPELKGLIIESGFLSVAGLIKHLRLPARNLDLSSLEQKCREKAAGMTIPALVIHGERDHIVPLEQGRELFASLGSEQKELVTIPNANHNNIMFVGLEPYFSALQQFISYKRRA